MADLIQSDFEDAPNDPSAQQVIAEAVSRLEALMATTLEEGKVSNELLRVALDMFGPTLRLLRYDLRMFENSTPEQCVRIAKASEAAGDLAIARAVLAAEPTSQKSEPTVEDLPKPPPARRFHASGQGCMWCGGYSGRHAPTCYALIGANTKDSNSERASE